MEIKYKENFLKKSRGMSHVVRYIQNPRIKDQNVATHSYHVALIVMYICDKLEIDTDIKNEALQEAIIHDIGEAVSMDMPSNVKRKNKIESSVIEDTATSEMIEIKSNTFPEVLLIVKLADLLDVIFYCSEEISMGNSFCLPIMAEAITAIDTVAKSLNDIIITHDVIKEIAIIIDGLLNAQEKADFDLESSTHIHKGI